MKLFCFVSCDFHSHNDYCWYELQLYIMTAGQETTAIEPPVTAATATPAIAGQ